MIVKALIVLVLAAAIFGSAGYVTYEWFVKPQKLLEMERLEALANPPTPPPDPSLGDFAKLAAIHETGDLLKAREAYRDFIRAWPHSSVLDEAKDALGEINAEIFFSKYPAPEKEEYTVQRGDALAKIASRMNTTVELLMAANNLESTLINVGDKLMVPRPDFALVIDQGEKTLTLYNHNRFFKRYRPIEWNLPGAAKSANARARVTSTMALKNGRAVALGSRDFQGSLRWIMTSSPGLTIYTMPDDSMSAAPRAPAEMGEDEEDDKPPTGIGLERKDAAELAALVHRGTPIIYQ